MKLNCGNCLDKVLEKKEENSTGPTESEPKASESAGELSKGRC